MGLDDQLGLYGIYTAQRLAQRNGHPIMHQDDLSDFRNQLVQDAPYVGSRDALDATAKRYGADVDISRPDAFALAASPT